MKAIVFAAGLGTRLRPLTDSRPKALVEVAGKPMLLRVVESLKGAGFDEITINVHHLAGQIIEYVAAQNDFGVTAHISDESDMLLDTGGGILKARRWLDGDQPFLAHNADVLTDVDLAQMYRSHLASGADVTLLTASRPTARYLLFDHVGTLRGWVNKSTGATLPEGTVYEPGRYTELAFGGVHVISPRIFPSLEAFAGQPRFSVIPFYVAMCNKLTIKQYTPEGDYRWFDVGKMETIHQVEAAFAR